MPDKKISELVDLPTPLDADIIPVVDNSGTPTTKKSTWANIKATLKAYFDTLYQTVLVSGTSIKTLNSASLLGSGNIAIQGGIPIAAAAGTADAITADYTPDVALTDLTMVAFVASGANATTTPTFAPDGLTAHTIVKKGGVALVAGDIPGAGAVCLLEYNSADTRWELLNPSSAAGGASTALDNLASVAINANMNPDSDDTRDAGSSTNRWANAQIVGMGRKNLIINGSGIVNQRVNAYTLIKDAYGFGPDRFAGMATGTAVSAGTLAQTSSANCGRTGYGFKFSGVTLTGTGVLYLRHRITAQDAMWLKNQNASFQAKVYHDVGSNVNYTIYVRKANSADNFAAVTNISNSGAIVVATATATTIKYENIAMGDCSTGIEIEIKVECGAITTKNFEFTEMQLEHGSKTSEIEYKRFDAEMGDCQNYLEKSFMLGTVPGSYTRYDGNQEIFANPTGTCEVNVPFKRMKVKTPAITLYDSAGNANKCDYYAGSWSSNGTVDTKIGTRRGILFTHAIASSTNTQFAWVADAEL